MQKYALCIQLSFDQLSHFGYRSLQVNTLIMNSPDRRAPDGSLNFGYRDTGRMAPRHASFLQTFDQLL